MDLPSSSQVCQTLLLCNVQLYYWYSCLPGSALVHVCTMESFCLFCNSDRPCCGKPLMGWGGCVVNFSFPICSKHSGCPCWFAFETKALKGSPCPVKYLWSALEDICFRSSCFCDATKAVPGAKKNTSLNSHTEICQNIHEQCQKSNGTFVPNTRYIQVLFHCIF